MNDKIYERNISPAERSFEIVQGEINALKRLIEMRNQWLANPENRRRHTYDTVKRDTEDMIWRYRELVFELQGLKQ